MNQLRFSFVLAASLLAAAYLTPSPAQAQSATFEIVGTFLSSTPTPDPNAAIRWTVAEVDAGLDGVIAIYCQDPVFWPCRRRTPADGLALIKGVLIGNTLFTLSVQDY